MFLGVAETILLVRFFIFCGVVWVLSYVFKSFVLRHGDCTRTQHQETTIQMPLIQFIICKYESFLFPRDSMFPGKYYHRCQRVLSFQISDISVRTGYIILLSARYFENGPLEPG